jgi:hypothetical protein
MPNTELFPEMKTLCASHCCGAAATAVQKRLQVGQLLPPHGAAFFFEDRPKDQCVALTTIAHIAGGTVMS